MDEHPTFTTHETPILDSNLFLLNHANRPLMGWHHEYMVLENYLSDRALAGLFSMSLVGTIILLSLASFLKLPDPFYVPLLLLIPMGVMLVMGGVIRCVERDILVKGSILPGVVTYAEKIHTGVSRSDRAHLGVRYQFTAPGGIVVEGYDEGDCENASYGMVPAPGRSVYVWYGDDENHYLL